MPRRPPSASRVNAECPLQQPRCRGKILRATQKQHSRAEAIDRARFVRTHQQKRGAPSSRPPQSSYRNERSRPSECEPFPRHDIFPRPARQRLHRTETLRHKALRPLLPRNARPQHFPSPIAIRGRLRLRSPHHRRRRPHNSRRPRLSKANGCRQLMRPYAHSCTLPLFYFSTLHFRKNPVSAKITPSNPTTAPPIQKARRLVSRVVEQITSPIASSPSAPSKRFARRLIKSRSFSNSLAFSPISSLSPSYRWISFTYLSRTSTVSFLSCGASAPSRSTMPCISWRRIFFA